MNLQIRSCEIGSGRPVYIIAELSANHQQDFETAVKLIEEAKVAGADAVKLQTYTPDTITLDVHNEYFQVEGTIWNGRNLYELYGEAYTPWEWHPKLKDVANRLGLALFSTPFDSTAVEFLEEMDVPAFKIASFELVDIPLIRRIAQVGKPIIMSTGMASLSEIDEAVQAVAAEQNDQLALLKCTSAYPSPPDEMNLLTIPNMRETFRHPVGLSDHTLGIEVPIAAVTLGACIIEKHITLSRSIPGPDSAFSLEPNEFKAMVNAIRNVELAIGEIHYGPSKKEQEELRFRRSLFIVQDVRAGELLTEQNVRSIRPSDGLHPRFLADVIGCRARTDIPRGTPLRWDLVDSRRQFSI